MANSVEVLGLCLSLPLTPFESQFHNQAFLLIPRSAEIPMGALPHPVMGPRPGRLASVAVGSIIGILSHLISNRAKVHMRSALG